MHGQQNIKKTNKSPFAQKRKYGSEGTAARSLNNDYKWK